MRAVQIERYGGPEVLRIAEQPVPEPGARQYLVRVLASSVNPVDWKMRRGAMRWFPGARLPMVLGSDVCGEVVARGPGAERYAAGDLVWAMLDARRGGAYAEHALVPESAISLAPARLPPEQAAAVPLAALTALQSLRDQARVEPGMRVLVVGASGGVGHFAVQIARALGAAVTATCSGRNIEFVTSLGAGEVRDYTRGDPYVSATPYDVVYDTIAAEPYARVARSLAKGGGCYVATLPRWDTVPLAFLLPLYSRRRIHFSMVRASGRDLDHLRGMVETGKLVPRVQWVYPLEKIADAHAESEAGRVRGKLVIRTAPERE